MARLKSIIRWVCMGLGAICAMAGLLAGLRPEASRSSIFALEGFDRGSSQTALRMPAAADNTGRSQFAAAEDSDGDDELAVRSRIGGPVTFASLRAGPVCRFGGSAQPMPGQTRSLQTLHVRLQI